MPFRIQNYFKIVYFMTESTISNRLGLMVSHYDSKLFSLCKLHVIEPFKSYIEATPSGVWLTCLLSQISAVEWQLISQPSNIIGVCRWVFFLWNCTPVDNLLKIVVQVFQHSVLRLSERADITQHRGRGGWLLLFLSFFAD